MIALASRPRTLGLAASLLLSATLPALPAPAETPEAFVRRVYARYKNDGPGLPMSRPEGTPFFTAGLLKAYAGDLAGGAGSIDWDPVCDCQNYENLRIRSMAVDKGDAETVKARVAFVNLRSPRTVPLTLAPTPAGWRIADAGSPGARSVMALPGGALAEPTRPEASEGRCSNALEAATAGSRPMNRRRALQDPALGAGSPACRGSVGRNRESGQAP